ncbi:DUF4328 domain-containing protein [Nocardia brasiliensis]|uniref:DUF4328 domain-containing protein n=1 Tax=Nocardia brasiliensis TaxID=37326 RepID=UPI00142DCCF2|nr:DUF4328 domain-containing protein [Nocardia brasiliensis]
MAYGVGMRHYRSLDTLGAVAIVALIVNMVVRAVFWVANWRNYVLLDEYAAGVVDRSELLRRSEELDTWFVVSLPVAALATVFTLSAVIAWLWRARGNAELGCATRHRLARGWVIGGWFVPVVSLWFPPVLVDDVVRASDPGTAPRAARLTANATTPLVVLWWLALLGGQLMLGVTIVIRLLTVLSPDPGPAAAAALFEAISWLLFAVAATTLGLIIARVGRWQADRHRACASAGPTLHPEPSLPGAADVPQRASGPLPESPFGGVPEVVQRPGGPLPESALGGVADVVERAGAPSLESTSSGGADVVRHSGGPLPEQDSGVAVGRGRGESGVVGLGGQAMRGPVRGGRESGGSRLGGGSSGAAAGGTVSTGVPGGAARSRGKVAVVVGAMLGAVVLVVVGAVLVVRQGGSSTEGTLAVDAETLRSIDPCTLLDQGALDVIGPGPAPEPQRWGECVRHQRLTAKYDTDSPTVSVRAGWTYFDAPATVVGETSFGLTMLEPDRGGGCVRQVATTEGNGIEIEVGTLPNGRDCEIATELVPRVLARLADSTSLVSVVAGSLIDVDPCTLVDRAVIRRAVGDERNRSMKNGVHVCRHSGNQTSLQVTLGQGLDPDLPIVAPSLIPFEVDTRRAYEVRAGESIGEPTSSTSLPHRFECEVRYIHRSADLGRNETVAIQVGEDQSRGVDHATACTRARSVLAALLPNLPTP